MSDNASDNSGQASAAASTTIDNRWGSALGVKLKALPFLPLIAYHRRIYWAVEVGMVTVEDVPTPDGTATSVGVLAKWLRESGIDAAYEGLHHSVQCPAWCDGDHYPLQDATGRRIGPHEEFDHTAPLFDEGDPYRFTLSQMESFEEGLYDQPGVNVELNAEFEDKVTSPEVLEQLSRALFEAAVRWRRLIAKATA